jgi:hypothetical protein
LWVCVCCAIISSVVEEHVIDCTADETNKAVLTQRRRRIYSFLLAEALQKRLLWRCAHFVAGPPALLALAAVARARKGCWLGGVWGLVAWPATGESRIFNGRAPRVALSGGGNSAAFTSRMSSVPSDKAPATQNAARATKATAARSGAHRCISKTYRSFYWHARRV